MVGEKKTTPSHQPKKNAKKHTTEQIKKTPPTRPPRTCPEDTNQPHLKKDHKRTWEQRKKMRNKKTVGENLNAKLS